MLFGITFGTIALVEGLTGGDGERSPGSYIGLVALFVGISAWGARLCWQVLQPRASGPGLSAVPPEMRVQAFAGGSGGRVTVLEVAANCDLTAEEAKRTLDRLAAEGSAAVRVTDDGILVYIFREQGKG